MKNLILFAAVFSSSFAQATPWDVLNNPAQLSKTYEYKFDTLPLTGKVSAAHMPWSDNYWESDWGGISFRWASVTEDQRDPFSLEAMPKKENLFKYVVPTLAQVRNMSKAQLAALSPAEKYDILMDRYDFPTVRAERVRTSPKLKDWNGLCHGWVPASINYSEPQPTELTSASGVTVPFGSTDIKGLLAYYYGVTAYDDARGNFSVVRMGDSLSAIDDIGGFDKPKLIPLASSMLVTNNDKPVNLSLMDDSSSCTTQACFDANSVDSTIESVDLVAQIGARIEKHIFAGGKSMKEPNAGAFYIVMANQLGLLDHAFAGDINRKLKNGEIWNQPIVGYSTEVNSTKTLAGGARKISLTTTLTYVSEIPQTWEAVLGTDKQSTKEMIFDYTLDVNARGVITGGDWDDQGYHPGYAWKHDKIEIRGYFARLNDLLKK